MIKFLNSIDRFIHRTKALCSLLLAAMVGFTFIVTMRYFLIIPVWGDLKQY